MAGISEDRFYPSHRQAKDVLVYNVLGEWRRYGFEEWYGNIGGYKGVLLEIQAYLSLWRRHVCYVCAGISAQ